MRDFAVIIPVRLNSKRLRRKILKKIGNYRVIEVLLKRLKFLPKNLKIIFAVSDHKSSTEFINYCRIKKINIFVGSKNNVALRMLNCANFLSVKNIIRINGDSPLTDPKEILLFIKKFKLLKCDLLTNIFPRSYPKGMSIEIFKTSILKNNINKFSFFQKEHVTSYFYKKSKIFKIKNIEKKDNYSNISFAIDQKKDLILLKKILKNSKFKFNSNLINLINIYLKVQTKS